MDYTAVIKRTLDRDCSMSDGMAALITACQQHCPDPAWDRFRELGYRAAADDLRQWLLERAPIPDRVEVIWFAMWDVTTGFDLRGSTSWSRDPEDWEWWYHDDFDAGGYEPPVLLQMHNLAREADDPDAEDPPDEGVFELNDVCLSLGFVSLAAVEALKRLGATSQLGRSDELWAVSGHPDALDGIILGRLTDAGFQAFAAS